MDISNIRSNRSVYLKAWYGRFGKRIPALKTTTSEGSTMNKYNVSRSAVKNAVARLGLTKTQAQNVLPKYAQGSSFVWSLESTSGSQAVYDNYNERVRLVIAENGIVLDVFLLITRYSHRTTSRKRYANRLRNRLKDSDREKRRDPPQMVRS